MRRSRRLRWHDEDPAPAQLKLITFGARASECTLHTRPARFDECMDCPYQRGAKGLGVQCAHRFGVDPTYVDGRLTQLQDGEIIPLDGPEPL